MLTMMFMLAVVSLFCPTALVSQRNVQVRSAIGGWVNGGAGVVVSAGLVDIMSLDGCLQYYPFNWHHGVNAADVLFGCCVADYWPGGKITHHKGFFRSPPGPQQHECECMGAPCTMTEQESRQNPNEVISFHHISPQTITVGGKGASVVCGVACAGDCSVYVYSAAGVAEACLQLQNITPSMLL